MLSRTFKEYFVEAKREPQFRWSWLAEEFDSGSNDISNAFQALRNNPLFKQLKVHLPCTYKLTDHPADDYEVIVILTSEPIQDHDSLYHLYSMEMVIDTPSTFDIHYHKNEHYWSGPPKRVLLNILNTVYMDDVDAAERYYKTYKDSLYYNSVPEGNQIPEL